jgi:ubiquinone/menaquinone biosynthesis C-methylase UbiE
MNQKPKSDHYGYTYYAREDTANEYEEDRYGSLFGKHLRALEIDKYLSLLAPEGNVLDVGTGSGKLFSALTEMERNVMGVDASERMISLLREKYKQHGAKERLLVADALKLPFDDESFNSIVSSRLLMHLYDWRRGITEVCRVAKKEVILDFPPVFGFTIVVPLVNVFKRLLRLDGTPYRVFSLRAVMQEFKKNGFTVVAVHRLFFLPIGVHRRLDNVELSMGMENKFGTLGLTRSFGGPVLVKAIRQYDNGGGNYA